MSNPTEAADALLDAINQHEIDGFGPWREVGPEEWARIAPNGTAHATAYLEIVIPGEDSELVHLVADLLPVETPVFRSDFADPDRAHDARIDEMNGVDL